MKKYILIAGAWPYANGSLHIGHLASLLPGDILARYHRRIGDEVIYVSGSDCYGTPITLRAKQEGKSPEDICEKYHQEFDYVFNTLGFSYDLYSKTTSPIHRDFIQCFHEELYKGEYIYEKTVRQAFCPECQKILTDRLIKGKCPHCYEHTRGDQCDACGTILEAENILEPACAECHSTIRFRETTQLFLAISKLENELKEFLEGHPRWRKNAIAFTKRYIEEGLRDRAITRDLEWGIEVPRNGYEKKRIYIWAENVLGYLSLSNAVCRERDIDLQKLWGSEAHHYYVHGKDNIPFHTIILPSLLLGHGGEFHLPDEIISSEYVTLEGRKISTSQNWAIWAKDLIEKYHPDAIRYFFIINGPEKRDTDFSWSEFVERNNNELLGAYGNFVNRTLVFVGKYLGGIVPEGRFSAEIREKIDNLYIVIGKSIENGHFKDGLETIFEFIREANRYFDRNEPWKTRNENIENCQDTLYQCIQIIANLSVLLDPFLPFSSRRIRQWLGVDDQNNWGLQEVLGGRKISEINILFERLDKSLVDEELGKLRG